MPNIPPLSVRLPRESIILLENVATLHGVSRHRLIFAILSMAARNPNGLAEKALAESAQKREMNKLKKQRQAIIRRKQNNL